MLVWICDQLDMPLVTETEFGVAVNSSAQRRLSRPPPAELLSCIQQLLDSPLDAPHSEALDRALASARQGTPSVVSAGAQQQILCVPDRPGRVSAIMSRHSRFAPGQNAASLTAAGPTATNGVALHDVAGVSHELANTLNAIAGWARLAQSGERVPEALALIERSAESAWATARDCLSGLGGRAKHEPAGVTDLSALVQEAANLIGPQAEANGVQVTTDLEPDLTAVGDRGALWSILWNLATNAVEAMPNGGLLQLALHRDGHSLRLVVQDAGAGMSGDVQAQMFDPYFTTKPNGTGIGLPFVKRIIDQLQGSIVCRSEKGRGTRFEVQLPGLLNRQAAQPGTGDFTRVSGIFMTEPLTGRYLIVDDDPVLRDLIGTALQMRGAEVVAVGQATSALQEAGPFTGAIIDLLLTDRRGDVLLSDLRAQGTVSWAVIITGTELPPDLDAGGCPDALLRKPFDLEALFESLVALEQALARATSVPASLG